MRPARNCRACNWTGWPLTLPSIVRWGEGSTRRMLFIGDSPLELVAAMDRDDAGRQVAHIDLAETSRLHHRLQRRLVGMLADRLGKVLVALGVVGDERAEARQDLERMEFVQRLEPFGLHRRELQYERAAAGLEHALHFAQRQRLV